MRIGFIGTGTMGTPIAGCLVAPGHRLTVYDIRRQATQALQGQGAATAETPRAVAETPSGGVQTPPRKARHSRLTVR